MRHALVLKYFTICILIAFSHRSYSDPDQVCEDLQKLVCAPGNYDDGTGSAANPTAGPEDQNSIQGQILKSARNGFIDALKSS